MKQLLNEMYHHQDDYGIDYFNRFLPKLKKYSFMEILCCLILECKYPNSFVIEFLLSTPSLWTNFTDTDWIRLMSRLNPRPKPFSIEIFNVGYVDIHFLCKYIRINAIDLFLQQKNFNNEEKKKILQYFNKINTDLLMDEFDLENLDGNYYVHQDELEKIRINILSNGRVKPLNYKRDELEEYLEKELENYL